MKTLRFYIGGTPPRRTHQGGKKYCRDDSVPGGIRVYTDEAHRAEAWEMRAEFRRQLPDGWEASSEPAEVSVTLAYPELKGDRLDDDAIIPHSVKPDVDNLVKSILDAMTRAGVWVDDAQVYDLRVRKFRAKTPRWTVNVSFGAFGFLDGKRMQVQDIRRALAQRRREAKKRAASENRQGSFAGLEGEP